MSENHIDRNAIQDQLDGLGNIPDGMEIPKDFVNEVPPSTTLASLLKALEEIDGISPEDKEELRQALLMADKPIATTFNQIILFILALGLVVSILAFFGLKLYRSLSERERRREEKRKLKQQRKKK